MELTGQLSNLPEPLRALLAERHSGGIGEA